MGKIKTILITKQKNPKLYKALLKKGGTVTFKTTTMTIYKKKLTFFESLLSKIKSITNKYA